MKNKLFTLGLSLSMTFVFAQDTKTFTKDNYTIDYPSSWQISEQKTQPAVQFMIVSDITSQAKDNFRENISLSEEPLQGKTLNAEQYSQILVNQINAQIPSSKTSPTKSINLNGIDAQELVWSADFGNGTVLKFKQVLFVNGNTGYAITYQSTTTEFDEYLVVADKIISSFKFVN